MFGRHLDLIYLMEQYLKNEYQDFDYTIVRPPHFLDDPIVGMFKILILLYDVHILCSYVYTQRPEREN